MGKGTAHSRQCLLGLLILCSPFLNLCASAQHNPNVSVWITTADRTSLLARHQPSPKFTAGPATGLVIEVDDSRRFQQMDGFGFALTGGSAELLMRMLPAHRRALLNELFGAGPKDIAVSYLRLSIGSSDMNSHVFTYDDLPPGETDPYLAKFNLGPDRQDVLLVLKEILAINPKIAILASPWSAPSWMKTNGLPKGGSLKPEDYEIYAQYLVRYLQAMAAEGISIRAITMQNEPLNPDNTPSMVMTAEEQENFLADALGPALQKADLKTEVILYDHNCDKPEYPLQVLADPRARKYATGSGFHLYAGTMDAMTKVHDAAPDKQLFFTEQMVTQQDNTLPLKVADSVSRIVIAAPRNWSRNVLLWNLAADPQDGPHTADGGCPVCQGAITLDGDRVTRNLAFYTIAHASKFVPPGSVRIASTSDGPLPNVAFSTPDHRTVLLVANPQTMPLTFHVKFRGRSFPATLAAGDVATYVWR